MKGYRTLAVNAFVAAATAGLSYLGGVEWTKYVDPTLAIIVVAFINAGLRWVTTTPVLKAE